MSATNITASFGGSEAPMWSFIPPEERNVSRRTLRLWIGRHPDDGDIREAVTRHLGGLEGLEPPLETLVISTYTEFWTVALASDIELATPRSVTFTEIRLFEPGYPGLERSLVYFPGQGLTGPPTYSSVSVPMDQLLRGGSRDSAILTTVHGMRSHLHTLYMIPPWDMTAFSQRREQYIEKIILILSALDSLQDLHLPDSFFNNDEWEEILLAFTAGGNSIPKISRL